jgi:hypothetical protein
MVKQSTLKWNYSKNTYTQREWDRTVGYGVVPDEYKKETNEHFQKDVAEPQDEEGCP